MTVRLISWNLRIDWDRDDTYTDESDYLVSANGTMATAPPDETITSGRGTKDSCTLVLDNATGRYSPLNTSGPLYSAIQDGGSYHAPVYLEVTVDAATARVFTGQIKVPVEVGLANKVPAVDNYPVSQPRRCVYHEAHQHDKRRVRVRRMTGATQSRTFLTSG